jgi:methyltransferase family protein
MLAVARALSPAIDWQEGTAEALPFPDRSFDAVVGQFGSRLADIGQEIPPRERRSVFWDFFDNIDPNRTAETCGGRRGSPNGGPFGTSRKLGRSR